MLRWLLLVIHVDLMLHPPVAVHQYQGSRPRIIGQEDKGFNE